MRIDLNITSLSQVVGDEKSQKIAQKAGSSSTLAADVEDKATLSGDALNVSALEANALSMPPVRQDRVNAVRSEIQSGQYKIHLQDIAKSILEYHRR